MKIEPALAQISNITAVQHNRAPLILLVGAEDQQTPPSLSQQLYQHASSPIKELSVIADRGHVNLLNHAVGKLSYQQFLVKAIGG